jgi:hypothetical protein
VAEPSSGGCTLVVLHILGICLRPHRACPVFYTQHSIKGPRPETLASRRTSGGHNIPAQGNALVIPHMSDRSSTPWTGQPRAAHCGSPSGSNSFFLMQCSGGCTPGWRVTPLRSSLRFARHVGEPISTSPTGTNMLAQPEWLGIVAFREYCSLKGSHNRHRIHDIRRREDVRYNEGNALHPRCSTHLGYMLTSPPGLPRWCDDSLLSRRY